MKKFLISLVVAAAALFATSCVNELDEGIKGGATGVTFEISTPELTSRADLFFGDCAAEKKLLYAVYDVTEGGNIVTKISKTELDNALRISKDAPTTFTLDLIDGNSYAVLFWAVSEDYSNAFSIDWTNKKMKMNPSAYANKESYDAFYSYITLDNVEGSISRSVVLERPFAQLNIGTSDFEEAKKANFDIDKIWSEVSLTNVPNVLDCTSGHTSVEGSAAITYSLAEMVVPTDYKFPVSGYDYLAMNYVLVGEEKSLANATVTTKDNTKAKTITNTYNNIPLARNFKTNVYGALLTNGSQFDVDVDNTWDGSLTITPMANEIWYTATEKVTPKSDAFGYATTIVSNEWDSRTGSGVITFSKGITTIGSSAFEGCTSLVSINIPDSVTEIGGYAFSGCTSLESINIPNSVTQISFYAFEGCSSLVSINIPNSVTSIYNGAFKGCTSLVSINIPNSVTFISGSTFSNCSSLESITIPNSVTSIGGSAFTKCSSLKNINIPDSVTSIGNEAFWGCSSLKNITIPNNVTEIGIGVFGKCSSLESITIGNGITSIKLYTFLDCSSLVDITIPNSVTSIVVSAFEGCSSLESITIPNSVTSIDGWAFLDCSSLKSINIPDGVTSIGNGTFSGCSSLANVYCKPTTPPTAEISDILGGWCAFDSNASGLKIYVPAESVDAYKAAVGWREYADQIVGMTIPNNQIWYTATEKITPNDITANAFGVNAISNEWDPTTGNGVITFDGDVTLIGVIAFCNCQNLVRISIPNSVTSIEYNAFGNCISLESITIPEGVTSIGDYAFSWCEKLQSINIPNSVTEIGENAFWRCSSLKNITIPDSVTDIGEGAFGLCNDLTEIRGKFASEDGRFLIVDGVLNSFAPAGLTEFDITIPNKVTSIGAWAFAECANVDNIIIPDSVTSIGDSAFAYCFSLTNITLPKNLTFIGNGAFWQCDSLMSITIPEKVGMIGYDAFLYCSSLKDVYCKSTTPPAAVISSDNSLGTWRAFGDNASGRKIYVPEESVDAYKAAAGWSEYADHIEGYNF